MIEFQAETLLAIKLFGNFDDFAAHIGLSRSSLYRASIGHPIGIGKGKKLLAFLQQELKDYEKNKRILQGAIDSLKLKV